MNGENLNSITYDQNWQSVSKREYPTIIPPRQDDDTQQTGNITNPLKSIKAPTQYLVTAQLIICVLIAVAAFTMKSIGGEWYKNIREWYFTQLNNSVIFDGHNSFDIKTFLGGASADEVQN